jgi:hypothetical protein
VLNKHKGLATWTNVQANALLADVPKLQTIYFGGSAASKVSLMTKSMRLTF